MRNHWGTQRAAETTQSLFVGLSFTDAKSENARELPHLGHYGVGVLCKGNELPLAAADAVQLLDPVLRRGSNQNDQHGLTGHVHLKHRNKVQRAKTVDRAL